MDALTIVYLILSTFFYGHHIIEGLDKIFGLYVLLDYTARFLIADKKVPFVISPLNLVDLTVLISFLAPLIGENFAFLRVIRVLRLFRSYTMLRRLREDFVFFRNHEDIVMSVINLTLFMFVMTELVFVTQVGYNDKITHFIDALYFTVTTLTTTGFGDITLQGTTGKFISIVIMIFGVSLFIRLIQTVFRPSKVRFPCPHCGLFLHDRDAVHCKHCGNVLNIPDEGIV
jgi:voltage-gated potassium channel